MLRRIGLALLTVLTLFALASCTEDEPRQTVTLVGTEMAFTPADVSVDTGKLAIRLQNDGRAFHEGAVEQSGTALGRVSAPPGQTAVLELDLDPGTYELTCREPGHYQSGMRGTLRVAK